MNVCPPGLRRSAATICLLALGSLAEAVPVPAISIDNFIGQTLRNPPFTLGWTFTVDGTIVVSQLGLFDSRQNGLVEAHDIGIWDEVGTLVATATIGAGTSGDLIDNFRYVAIAPVTLEEGATLDAVVRALNALGATPRDVIAILQAMKAAGALTAELVII